MSRQVLGGGQGGGSCAGWAQVAAMGPWPVFVWDVALPVGDSRVLCGASRDEASACAAMARTLRCCAAGTQGTVRQVLVSQDGERYLPVSLVGRARLDPATNRVVWTS